MRVQVFAILKDYFDKEFELHENIHDMPALRERLIQFNPAAAGILNSCRFAVKDEFIDNDFQLAENDTIYIIPPGSGG
ncbi:MAG: MoaD/ThiS family protein [Chitinophagaceae bacterium]